MISTGIAFAFGFFHALEPGHGKTALLTYIASGKKSWKEGAVLSVTSAFTHTLSILVIAFVVHCFTHHRGVINKIVGFEHVLSIASGLLITGIGVWVIARSRKKQTSSCCSCHHHHHDEEEVGTTKKRQYLTSGMLGVAVGMIPCPSVMVAYLTGAPTSQSWLGMENVIFFAAGMCLALMLLVTLCSLCSEKLITKLKGKTTKINWRLIQGSLFVLVGFATMFYH